MRNYIGALGIILVMALNMGCSGGGGTGNPIESLFDNGSLTLPESISEQSAGDYIFHDDSFIPNKEECKREAEINQDVEPNNTPAQAVTIPISSTPDDPPSGSINWPKVYSGSLNPTSDPTDYYKFVLPSAYSVSIQVDDAHGLTELRLRRGTNAWLVIYDRNEWGIPKTCSWIGLGANTYWIEVTNKYNATNYTLRFAKGLDVGEPYNNNCNSSTPLLVSSDGQYLKLASLEYSKDNLDYWMFQTPAAGAVCLDVYRFRDGVTSYANFDAKLRDNMSANPLTPSLSQLNGNGIYAEFGVYPSDKLASGKYYAGATTTGGKGLYSLKAWVYAATWMPATPALSTNQGQQGETQVTLTNKGNKSVTWRLISPSNKLSFDFNQGYLAMGNSTLRKIQLANPGQWSAGNYVEMVKLEILDYQSGKKMVEYSFSVYIYISSQQTWVSVLSPNGGEQWQVNTSHAITWSSQNLSGNVKIEYYNGSYWDTIISSTANDGYHDWTVPNTPTTSAKVKVSSVNDPGVYDTSNSNFAIVSAPVPSITVSSPNGGEQWQVNTSHAITWSSQNLSGNVKIEYYNGSYWDTIISSTANDGYHDWTVPNTPTTSARVWLSSVSDPSVYDVSDDFFSIVSPPVPVITVLSPDGGEQWLVNMNHGIAWSSQNITGNVKIEYYNGSYWDTVVSSTANDGYHDWTVPNTPTTLAKVKVSSVNNPNIYDQSNSNFSIVIINVSSPNGGEQWQVNTTHAITWTSQNLSGNVKIEYYNGSYWDTVVSSTANDGYHDWTVPNTPTTLAKVKVSSVNSGNVYDISDNTFSILSPPAVIKVTCPDGGGIYGPHSTLAIMWTSQNVNGNVKIKYFNGSYWDTVVSSTANDGYYEWSVPNTPTTYAIVEISSINDPSVYDASNQYFTIDSIIVFPDSGLNLAVRNALNKPNGYIYKSIDLPLLTNLNANSYGISNLEGLQYCINLTKLDLQYNNLVGINKLQGLTKLTELDLYHNSVSDISPLVNLTQLVSLRLGSNPLSQICWVYQMTKLVDLDLCYTNVINISYLAYLTKLETINLNFTSVSDINSLRYLTKLKWVGLWSDYVTDIAPLDDNTGIGQYDTIVLYNNPLDWYSKYVRIPALQLKGVTVLF